MTKEDKIKVKNLIHGIGLEYGLSDEVVQQIVESQYEFVAEKLKELDLDSLKNIDDVEALKGTFLFKTFGKLYLNKSALINILKKQGKWEK